jgi:hypothetical protein
LQNFPMSQLPNSQNLKIMLILAAESSKSLISSP